MRRWLTLFLLGMAAPLAAAGPADLAGSWVMSAEGRPLVILDVERDPTAPEGWRVADHGRVADIDASGNVSNVRMDVHTHHYRVIAATPDRIDVEQDGPDRTRFVLRGIGDGLATWQPAVFRAPPFLYVRVAPPVTLGSFDPARHYVVDRPYPDNPAMKTLFDADQAARDAGAKIDWKTVWPADAARRRATQALLDRGELLSGTDFWEAAFVFQHGDSPADFLKAHALAIIAAARGRPDATWIAAATLDRYLQRIGQKQVYGTQFTRPPGGPTTQEPYDRTLMSDALRIATGVPDQAGQEDQKQAFERMFAPAGR